MDDADLAPPTFESDREGNQFTARLLMHHFLSPKDLQWLDRFEGLSSDQMKGLVFVREVGAIDNAAYRQLNGLEVLEASSALRKLCEQDLLRKQGGGKATYYVPGAELSASPEMVDFPGEKVDEPDGLSNESEPLSTEPFDLSREPESLSKESVSLEEELPRELRDRVEEVGKRTSPETLKQLIVDVCAWRELRAEQIAKLIGRNMDYLVTKYLTPMVEEGNLEYTIPEVRNHPQQAYRTASDE